MYKVILILDKLFLKYFYPAGKTTLQKPSLIRVNKVAILTAWPHLTVLERDSSTGISLWILLNFKESFFVEHLATTSHTMLVFFLFWRSMRFIWWSYGKLGGGIHKPVQCCVVKQIRWKLHCQVVATHVPI